MNARKRSSRASQDSKPVREEPVRILVFLQGTILMHSGAAGRSREERVAQSRAGLEPSLRDHATYVPIGSAVAKLKSWQRQGARICYLTSSRNAKEIEQDTAVLKHHGFPKGPVLARHQGEQYGDVAGRVLPDVLVEDDCESIGLDEITYPQIRADLRARIRSVVVPEFDGIDHLPGSLDELLASRRPRAGKKDRALRGGTR
jgi:hypothetical protein